MTHDKFQPREYQEALVEAVLANVAQGRRLTIGLAAPGYGKQNASIWVAIRLARDCGVPLMITFVPRLNLAGQYEIGYEGPYVRQGGVKRPRRDRSDALIEQFGLPRLNHLEHRPNADPLVGSDWQPPFGIVACYASLVKDMGKDGKGYFRSLAREYEGRFLLHADEAQFCGAVEYGEGDAITGGVLAGAYLEELDRHSFHTLLQTGTENRADGEELVLCRDRYADPGPGETRGPLIPDAEGTYGRARELHYLREFEIDYIDDHVRLESLDGADRMEYELSESPKYLAQILRREAVWQPLCDKVLQRLEERQKIWPGYKALICCMDQNHAEAVCRYLRHKRPGLKDRILLAISREQGEATANLRLFRDHQKDGEPSVYDVLVTVRMAFIGYDCKEISVVGILTNYRDQGHLYQQAGRGLRVLASRAYGEQVCWMVAPADPQMRAFIRWLKIERKRGTKGGDGELPESAEPTMHLKDAYATAITAEGLGATIYDPAEYAEIERLRAEFGIYEPATKLKRLKDAWTAGAEGTLFEPAPDSDQSEQFGPPQTSKEAVRDLKGEVRSAGVSALSRCGIRAGHERYGDAMNWFYDKVAALSFWAGDATTPERAMERLEAAEKVKAAVFEKGELWW